MSRADIARPSLMRTTAGLSFALCLACAGGLYTTPAHAAQPCHRPQPQTLIAWYKHTHPQEPLHYDPKNSAIYHPISILHTDRPSVYWMGLAWLAPESGALFAVSCDGTPVAGMPTGAIGRLSPGPVLAELGPSVMLVYVSKETGDCVQDAVQIVALKDNKIISLWEHGYNQGLNVPASGATPRGFISETYALSFTDNGRTLRISGRRAAYAYHQDGSQASVPAAAKALPTETYHWDASARRFIPEEHYRQPSACDVN